MCEVCVCVSIYVTLGLTCRRRLVRSAPELAGERRDAPADAAHGCCERRVPDPRGNRVEQESKFDGDEIWGHTGGPQGHGGIGFFSCWDRREDACTGAVDGREGVADGEGGKREGTEK